MKMILCILMLVIDPSLFADALSRQSRITRTWDFKKENATISISVLYPVAPSGSYASLTITLSSGVKSAEYVTLQEEASCVAEVLKQLPSIGIDPKFVLTVYFPYISDNDTKRKMAIAAAYSKKVQKEIKEEGIVKPETLVELLDSVDAYNEFKTLFKQFGCSFSIGYAEEVIVAQISTLKLTDLPSDISRDTKVPVTATIMLHQGHERQ